MNKDNLPLEENMYLVQEIASGIVPLMTRPSPVGPGFNEEELEGVVKVEVWGTTMNHKDEFTDFYLFNANNDLVRVKRVLGY